MARITQQTYNDMQAAYLEHQTVDYVHKKCKVAYRTAHKYVHEGDPKRGWLPLNVVQRMAAERATELAADNAAINYNKFQTTAQNILDDFEKKLTRVSVSDLKELMELLEEIEERKNREKDNGVIITEWYDPDAEV
jgi:hypothetical protein